MIDKEKAGEKYYWYQAMCRDDAELAGFTNDSIGSVNYLKAFPVVDGEPTVPTPPCGTRTGRPAGLQRIWTWSSRSWTVTRRPPKAPTKIGRWSTSPRGSGSPIPQALGGNQDVRSITAKVTKPGGGTLSVQVTARTRGLKLSSPAAESMTCPASPWPGPAWPGPGTGRRRRLHQALVTDLH